MLLSEYDYNLPEELIAQVPADKRENSRMLVLDRAYNSIEHRHFYDIVDLLDENYLEKIKIRDPNDQIILNSAVENNVDYLLTGDKDFLVLNIQNPKCVSINEMIEILNIKIKV